MCELFGEIWEVIPARALMEWGFIVGVTEEAGKIRQLAEDVRKLLDQPIEIAADAQAKKDERWQGPTAEKVRGELKVRKTRLGSMAEDLERAATQRGKEDSDGGS